MYEKFTERIGLKKPKVAIQTENMDKELRNGLWNILTCYVCNPMKSDSQIYENTRYKDFIHDIWFYYFKEPVDEISFSTDSIVDNLRKRFFNWNAYEVYDFIDFIPRLEYPPFEMDDFIHDCNYILEKELSGYRFVGNNLAPITNKIEIDSIEDAIEIASSFNLTGTRFHLQEALLKLSDRKNPDYRNSIKESVSAVESICKQLSGDAHADLNKAMKKLENKTPIHGALKQGFLNIYGFTSDGEGIRHALLDEPNLHQEDALFMLVACSAFVNYLIAKANKLKLI
jgi:hypothetical protein